MFAGLKHSAVYVDRLPKYVIIKQATRKDRSRSMEVKLRNFSDVKNAIQTESGSIIGRNTLSQIKDCNASGAHVSLVEPFTHCFQELLEKAPSFAVKGIVGLSTADLDVSVQTSSTSQFQECRVNHLSLDFQDIELDSQNTKFSLKEASGADTLLHCVEGLKPTLSTQLFDNMYSSVDISLQALAVCSTDGCHEFSYVHSTPRDTLTFIGTLLVCLPSSHDGGNITVKHGCQECVFGFSAESSKTGIAQFVAMYSKCSFQVEPVTDGTMVMLQYDMYRCSTVEAGSSTAQQPQTSSYPVPTIQAKSKILDAPHAVPRCMHAINAELQSLLQHYGHLGLFLSDSYIHAQNGLRPESLCGYDKMLFDLVCKEQIPVSLVHVVCGNLEVPSGTADPTVRLIDVTMDGRIPEHKALSRGTLFICGWSHVSDVDTHIPSPPSSSLPRVSTNPTVSAVDTKHIYGAMILGPLPRTLRNMRLLAESEEDGEAMDSSGSDGRRFNSDLSDLNQDDVGDQQGV